MFCYFLPMMLIKFLIASFCLKANAHYNFFSQSLCAFKNNPVSSLNLDEATVIMKYHKPRRVDLGYFNKILNKYDQDFSNVFTNTEDKRNLSYRVWKGFGFEGIPSDLSSNLLNSMSKRIYKREISSHAKKSRQERSPMIIIPIMTNPGMPFLMQSPNPYTMQSPYPAANPGGPLQNSRQAALQIPGTGSMQSIKPAMMQSINPALMQSVNPLMMQSMKPTMMQRINPVLMQSISPLMMQSPNPLLGTRSQIVFVPMMMAMSPQRGKRETPNGETKKREKRSPIPYRSFEPAPSKRSVSNDEMIKRQKRNPIPYVSAGPSKEMKKRSEEKQNEKEIKKSETPNKEMRRKRSPLTYQLVPMPLRMQSISPMPLRMQSVSPMALQNSNLVFMQSPNPMQTGVLVLQNSNYPYIRSPILMPTPGMVYMMPMTSNMRMG